MRRRSQPCLAVAWAVAWLMPADALAHPGDLQQPSSEPLPLYGGELTPTCAWPSTVYVGGCSGTLIHPEVVVYAAHCGTVEEVWFGEVADESPGFAVPTESCKTNVGWELGNGKDFAFCKLAEPVTEVPFTPPLMGCETTLLTPGREVTLVGFGLAEDDTSGIKRQLTLPLNFISESGEAQTGSNDGKGVCFGDSGGPAFVRLPEELGGDGSWRVFGIASYITGGACGLIAYHSLVHEAVPWIEAESGIDVTPCHYANGDWNPSPACVGFPLEPWDGEGKTWAGGCGGGPVGEPPATCGAAFDDTPDFDPPEAAIVEPAWGERFDSDPDTALAEVPIEAVATDAHSGVGIVALSIEGEVPENATRHAPPWAWSTVKLPPGVWTLRVVATDWAGNVGESAPVVVGVDRDPPPMPPEDPDTGTDGGGSSSSASTSTSIGEVTSETGDAPDSDTDGAPTAVGDSGCGCRSQGGGPLGLGGLFVLAIARRRQLG